MMATGLLCRQHRRIEQLLRALRSDDQRRNRLLLDLLGQLTSHLAVEANVLYPGASRVPGLPLTHAASAHGRVREALYELMSPGISSNAFVARVDRLSNVFAAHSVLDESAIYPVLVRHLDVAALGELGDAMASLSAALVARSRRYIRAA